MASPTFVNGGYWISDMGFPVGGIDSKLFTHLFCAFADINSSYEVIVSPEKESSFSQFTRTVKTRNPSVITLLSIRDTSSATFSSMASRPTWRKSFIDSAIKVARDYTFSGLDLYWKYPATSDDMVNLGILLSEWRQAINAEEKSSGLPALLLTAAVFFSPNVDSTVSYPAPSINSNTDWVNVMAYDFYNPSRDKFTNSHSMLNDPLTTVSGSAGISAWIEAGSVSPNKLVLGLPFYGYGWILADASKHDLLAQAIGPAFPDDGLQTYKEITTFILQKHATVKDDPAIVANYCYAGTTWIGYDDTPSISAKVSYIKQQKLLGYFAWHVGADDDEWTLSKTAKRAWEA